jgi:hypothetical protein
VRSCTGWSNTFLLPAFKAGRAEAARVFRLLAEEDWDKLHYLFVNGSARRWLKLFALVGRHCLRDPQADEITAVKLVYSLAYGLENLNTPNWLSPDLKEAFVGEIVRTMALAFDNPALSRRRDALAEQYRRALQKAVQIKRAT